ncbi:uncharacterized protein N0V89_003945 [Didymosphaeria variabile]|uniref:Bromo domain-containing protein n=1 Tax=Didymosphaeria variabile TaxID=1932322 RepID=A0A9W8XNJ5_9PLEO|nr:uncharacterized protein N0V89_003945 [Didymosphaeria variabile]KAJ4355920.1 hypothetical protein N0V89_003945 [Didymosphaeria variabile]
MNTSLTAYTHLESLLLFQSLHAYGLGPQVFSRISELLKANPHITSDKRFQSGRLSPDALRNFYLHILKEEIRNERDQADVDATNGEIKVSRKRKAPSPSLPTVQESLQHQHLIPKLVNKLYAHYRAAITEQIRQDEDRYERLQRELQGIERGEWDNQIKERANGKSASRSPSLPKKSPLLTQQSFPTQPNANSQDLDTNRANGPPTLAPVPGAHFHPNLAPGPQQNGQVSAKAGLSPSPRKKQTSVDRRGKQSTPQPPGSSQPPNTTGPHPTQQGQPPLLQSHPSTPGSLSVPSPGSQHGSYQGFPQHLQSGHASGPQYQQPIQPYVANGVSQLAPSPGPQQPQHSPTHQHFIGPNPQSPSVQTPHQQRSYMPIAGQPPYLPQHPQPGQPPPQGGFMLPPFQVAPQDPSRSQQQAAYMPQQHQVSTPVSGRQSTKVTPHTGRSGFPPMQPLHKPTSNIGTPRDMRDIIRRLSTPRTPNTSWKPAARSLGSTPASRPNVSPIDDFPPSRDRQQTPPKAKSTRKSRSKGKVKQKEQEPEPDSHVESDHPTEGTVPEMETRHGRSRRKAPIKKGRPGSIASSQAGTSVRGRSRSHSILSHTETIAADTESQAGSRIKSEDHVDDELAATPSQMSTRGRSAAKSNNKRKRNLREVTPEESEDGSGTPGLPKTVVATRHFSRMCAPLMNDIGSHKHASTFTTAVKAKDAEGYYDIIKRPTDIKTIQKAIAAGAKQVAAAASGDTPSGSPGGAGGIVELPLTVDNMPPKAIVNSAQLEKELMRMFVNAVMFNPGEAGVVEDAREMFESVQRSVSSWRSVEPSSGRMEVEETPPAGEEDVPVAAKRRKL